MGRNPERQRAEEVLSQYGENGRGNAADVLEAFDIRREGGRNLWGRRPFLQQPSSSGRRARKKFKGKE